MKSCRVNNDTLADGNNVSGVYRSMLVAPRKDSKQLPSPINSNGEI